MFKPSFRNVLLRTLVMGQVLLSAIDSPGANKAKPVFTFCCAPTNDLFLSLDRAGEHYPRFYHSAEALNATTPNTAVLILADNYPAQTVSLSTDDFTIADKKNLRLYLEYPASDTPGLDLGEPKNTEWERCVVASDDFGTALPKLRLLALHDCHFVPVRVDHPMLVIARVAGFDTAVYGIPTNAWPILFEVPEHRLMIATTRLSGFIQNRFAPADDLTTVWETILARLDPQSAPHKLKWSPLVTPAFSRDAKLPHRFEKNAFADYAKWITNSRLLVSPDRWPSIRKALATGG